MNNQDDTDFVVSALADLPAAAAGEPFRFVVDTLTYLHRWCLAHSNGGAAQASQYCIFISTESLASDVARGTGWSEIRLFREDTPATLLGNCYLTSTSLFRVFSCPISANNFDDCLKAIEAMGFSDRAVVLFNVAARQALWSETIDKPFHRVSLENKDRDALTPQNFDVHLDAFHVEYSQTPEGLARVWDNARNLITKAGLELELRNDLFIYFRHLSPAPHTVIREYQNAAGRADLLVYFPATQLSLYIELKVLRSYRKRKSNRVSCSDQFNLYWGKRGIAQAFTYVCATKGNRSGYACCFDARSENIEMDALVQFANDKKVQYRRFFMYPSTEALQEELMN